MKNRNLILFLILLLVSTVVFIVPLFSSNDEVTPNTQLSDIISTERYLSSENLASFIINQDPSIVIIDIRTEDEFKQYHLPTAINIPFELLLNEENKSIVNQSKQTIVFYSNDHLLADNAWFLTKNLGYKNIIVLKDGLNGFFNSILNPEAPSTNASTDEKELYLLRKSSGIFFGIPFNNAPQKSAPILIEKPVLKKVEPVKKVKVEIEEGGC